MVALAQLSILLVLALPWVETHPHPSHNRPTTRHTSHLTTRLRTNTAKSNTPPSPEQDTTDHAWVTLAHQIGLAQNPDYPFGAAIVDSRTDSLLCVSSNQIQNGNGAWSKFSAHGEMVVLENCTELFLPDVATEFQSNNANWQYMTLYSNIEPCPMCAQAIIWRGVRRAVFGARAMTLQDNRCWQQSNMTFQEVVDQSSHFAPFEYVRGPIDDLEETIVADFPSFCTNRK